MAFVFGLAVLGRLLQPIVVPTGSAPLVAAVVLELAMGLVIGLGVRVIFTGVAIGAWHVAEQMGLTLGEAAAPSHSEPGGPVQRLFFIGAVAVFVLLDGHVQLAAAMVATCETLPLGTVWQPAGLLRFILALLGSSFLLALKVASPVLLALIVVTVVLGVVQRSIPQVHVLSIGLPLRAVLGLIAIGGAIVALVPLTDAAWRTTRQALEQLVQIGHAG
jgi:flagellar biosynthetic protein FliR